MLEVIPCEGSFPDPNIMEQATAGRSLAAFPAARVGEGSGPTWQGGGDRLLGELACSWSWGPARLDLASCPVTPIHPPVSVSQVGSLYSLSEIILFEFSSANSCEKYRDAL